MKKESKYWKKRKPKEKVFLGKEWIANNGELYDSKRKAQVASFLSFIRGGLMGGFPIPIKAKWWFGAFTIYPFIFIRCDAITIERLNHEKIHIRQMRDLFVIGAYVWYPAELYIRFAAYFVQECARNGILKIAPNAIAAMFYAYTAHSMEAECLANQHDHLYLFKRKKFAFLNYL